MSHKAVVYVDGFNLYHALDDLNWAYDILPNGRKRKTKRHNLKNYLKWLDLIKLSGFFVYGHNEVIEKVIFFTAPPTHKFNKMPRYRAYIAALRALGVECVEGRFKEVTRHCKECNSDYTAFEEKETDVNIGVRLVKDALTGAFDTAYLISNDTDLIPAIKIVTGIAGKKFVTVAPPERTHAAHLLQVSTRKQKINEDMLEQCLLPNIIGTVLKPVEYEKKD